MFKREIRLFLVMIMFSVLAGCDYPFVDSLDKNDSDLYDSLLAAGIPVRTVSDLKSEFDKDSAAAEKEYLGHYVILAGIVADVDDDWLFPPEWSGDLKYFGSHDTELVLAYEGTTCLCCFDDYMKELEFVEDGDIVIVAGIFTGMLTENMMRVDSCGYIDIQ